MRVAITGASGFIGRHLSGHLEHSGHDVLRLGRHRTSGALAALGEDQDHPPPLPELLTGVEAVCHLAAQTVTPQTTTFSDFVDANVVLTETVVRAAVAAGAHRFLQSSSRLVYSSTLKGAASESGPVEPDTFYGLSKWTAEQVVRLHAGDALTATALRIGQVIGPGDGDRGALNRFINQARTDGLVTVSGEGAAVRDVVDIRDVVRSFELALEAEDLPAAVNIGGGGHSILELAEAAARGAGLNPSEAVVHAEVDHEDRSQYQLDCRLAAASLGWRPQQSVDDMVEQKLSESR